MKSAPASATCSARAFRPVLRLLDAEGADADLRARVAAVVESDGRVPALEAMAQMDAAAGLLGDPDLGLRAAMHSRIGDFPALEWVAMTAPTWREATRSACRYACVLSDVADFRHEIHGQRSHLILGLTVPASRVVVDFLVASYSLVLRLHSHRPVTGGEVWFEHPRPDDVSVYEAIFPEHKVVFGAAFNGLNGRAAALDEPLETANTSLHDVLREHAESVLQQVAPDGNLVARVCGDILQYMGEGRATAELSSSRLAMSRRTLTRQLADHRTTYKELLAKTRYRSAVHHLRYSDHTVEDVAFLLGYSDCANFVRAFGRWSGHSPDAYRGLHGAATGPQ